MKHIFVITGVLAAGLISTTPVGAQMGNPPSPFTFGVSGGLSIPTGDFAEGTKNGFNAGAHVGIRQALWPVGLRLEGQYNRFEDDLGLEAYLNVTGVSLNVVIVPSGMSRVLKPYVIAGPSFFHIAADATNTFGAGATSSQGQVGVPMGAPASNFSYRGFRDVP